MEKKSKIRRKNGEVWLETTFGDYEFVLTDFSKGSSCDQCDLLGRCLGVFCYLFDEGSNHYHMKRRSK